MPCPPRSAHPLAALALTLFASTVASAQEPTKPEPKVEASARPVVPLRDADLARPILEFKEEIKPLPPVAIPDEPPPHEGAFFDVPLTIEPPDIILVEVLEALPGRPITGGRLVRPDGTISLGFYGSLHVRGLTTEQAKVKVIIHLRRFISDETLGLLTAGPNVPEEGEMPMDEPFPVPNAGRNPFDLELKIEKRPGQAPNDAPPVEKKPDATPSAAGASGGRPSARSFRPGLTPGRSRRVIRPTSAQEPTRVERRTPPRDDQEPVPAARPDMEVIVIEPVQGEGGWTAVPPADSDRVFVDFTNHNSKMYFVEGDVGSPGRLAFTGKDTVLDALNYAGGLVPSAERSDIHLYRPARGGKPAKDYKIDLDAIRKGVATANLQLFPDDRLVVGRNPIVARTIELDRIASPINSMMNAMLQYSLTARSMAAINTPTSSASIKTNGPDAARPADDLPAMNKAQRDALMKDWAEFFWSLSAKGAGEMVDEKAFREALMKRLSSESGSK